MASSTVILHEDLIANVIHHQIFFHHICASVLLGLHNETKSLKYLFALLQIHA